MSDRGEKGGLLSRWERRKAAVAAEQARERDISPAGQDAPQLATEPHAPAEVETDEAVLERLGLPAPETLRPDDDFAAFLQAPLSAALRRRALRQLWRMKPALANLDGLLDYGEDFTSEGKLGAVVQSAWKAGRGYLDAEETETGKTETGKTEAGETEASEAGGNAPEAGASPAPVDETPADTHADTPVAPDTPSDTPQALPEPAPEQAPELAPELAPEPASEAPVARMHFRFDQP